MAAKARLERALTRAISALAGAEGLEPTALGFGEPMLYQLSYTPKRRQERVSKRVGPLVQALMRERFGLRRVYAARVWPCWFWVWFCSNKRRTSVNGIGSTKEIALDLAATQAADHPAFLVGFHAFCRGRHAQAFSKRNHRADDRNAFRQRSWPRPAQSCGRS